MVGDIVPVGRTVRFQVRDAAAADADLRDDARRLPRVVRPGPVEGALLFSCNGRGAHLFGTADHDPQLVQSELAGHGVAGCFAAGEIGPVGGRNFVHGFTASILAFGSAAARMSSRGPVLAVDIGGTKLAAALVDADGQSARAGEVPTQPVAAGDGEALWATLARADRRRCAIGEAADAASGSAAAVRCGGRQGVGLAAEHPGLARLPAAGAARRALPGSRRSGCTTTRSRWRSASTGAAPGSARQPASASWSSRPGSAAVSSSAAASSTARPATPATSATSSSTRTVPTARAAAAAASRRSRAARRWCSGRSTTAGRRGTATPPTAARCCADAEAGDAIAVAAFARAGEALGIAIASAAHLFELDVVAVGGGLSNAGELLLAPARTAFARHARMEFAAGCRIVRAALGADAGLVGAAALVACGDRYWTAGAD